MNKAAAGLLLCACLAGAMPQARSERLDFNRTFKVAPGGSLTVRAESGSVRVTGSDTDQVVVSIVATGTRRTLDRMTLIAEQTSEGVNVTAERDHRHQFDWMWSGGDKDVRIDISVPRRYGVDLGTSGGDIGVTHLVGDTTGTTSGGDVSIDDVQGPVTMKASGGDMSVVNIRGRVQLRTSGGNIHARTVAGDFTGYTSGGDVKVEALDGAVRLRTTGGNVTATRVAGTIEARTSGGDVQLNGIDGAVEASTSGGDVRVELVGANRGVDVSTSGGGIVVLVPATVTATLDADSGNGRIRSDLPVTNAATGESSLNGTINGGGELIHARTSGGEIELRVRHTIADDRLERS